MSLSAGTRLGPYEIVSPLGTGGMGEVYRARDTRLGREVAIKVLPESVAQDRGRLSRFEQEARSASALNHPNIVTVYDIGRVESVAYIAMELVEGRSLREILVSEPLPTKKLLSIAAQTAEGLAKAHAAGIVHRDLKPENLMVSGDGFVKILDFGLAKLSPDSAEALSLAPTAALPRTLRGSVLGTVGYMSPEQASGAEVDYRSDQFSFGSILYEMAAGKKAFERGTVVDTLSAILHEEPEPMSRANPDAPAPLAWIIERCLAKSPEERYASTRDLARDLSSLKDRLSQVSGAAKAALASPVAGRRRGERLAWGVAGAALLAAAVFGAVSLRRTGNSPRVIRASLDIPQNPAFGILAVSPDGTRLAYVGPRSAEGVTLWVRPLDSLEAQELPGTKGAWAQMPFWSPDGRFLGFFADGKLKKIAVSGGPPQTLCEAPSGRGGTWSREGVILFAPSYTGPLSRVSAQGGTAVAVTGQTRSDFSHRWPIFLPDGRHFLFVALVADPAAAQTGQVSAVLAGSLDSKETRLVLRDASNVAYVAPGYLLFAREGNLLAQRFDASRLEAREEPFAVSRQRVSFMKRWSFAEFSISQNGLLAYKPPFASRSQLVWLDRTGREKTTVGEPGFYRDIRLSRDGERIALVRFEPETKEGDIWLYEKGRNLATRFTFRPAFYTGLVWMPDDGEIVFNSNALGIQDIYRKSTSGSGKEEPILQSNLWKTLSDISLDGRFLAFDNQDPRTGQDIWAMPLSGDRKPFPILQTPFAEMGARFSPDGRWLAYNSNDSGREEVYVRPFPGPGGKWQISSGGGNGPVWRRDGKELFYESADGKLMAAEVETAADFRVGAVRPLFETRDMFSYDAAPDGQRFLVLKAAESQRPSPIALVLNWTSELPR